MNYAQSLSKEFKVSLEHAQNIINLIDEGNTIPFIARYRKEMTGSCDDQVLRELADRLDYLKKLTERKQAVVASITEQGLITPEILQALESANTLTEVEDIYRPYKPKRKTRATVAMAKGLSPLADILMAQDKDTLALKEAKAFINADLEVNTVEEALAGAQDIVAERVSDDANLRKLLREYTKNNGVVASALDAEKDKEKAQTYEMYASFSEAVAKIADHRVLAINRGNKEGVIKFGINAELEGALKIIYAHYVKEGNCAQYVKAACDDGYDRLIKPSIEREIWTELLDKAFEKSIKMFEDNLRPLLLQPPIKNKVTLGLDPAYRTGCKICVVDGAGNVLDRDIVYFTPPQNKVEESKTKLTHLILKHKVEIIAIGNGTASKESEIFVANLIKELPCKLSYMMVNEAGASVYSASKLAAEEFPEFEPAHRSAASIARRLQDPLAELIKIDPKSIGVGQYQHDMPQKRLDTVLQGVVEDCVNTVGVDLNSASYSLLSYVSGLNGTIAKNITEYRRQNGRFVSREQLKKVSKLGPKAYEQCAGFLRIVDGKNILDNTGVHPESYEAAQKLLDLFKLKVGDSNMSQLDTMVKGYGTKKVCEHCNVGEPTLLDIITELKKPGRDIRDELPPPMLRSDIMDMNDLKAGMELDGTVRNVIDFGAFIDIGVHQDGLVHISEISDTFIKHPSEVLKVGQLVKVRVLSVDVAKKRIALTMKSGVKQPQQRPAEKQRAPEKSATSLEDALKNLKARFS